MISTNSIVRNAMEARNRVSMNASKSDSVGSWLAAKFKNERAFMDRFRMNVTFQQLLDRMKKGEDFYQILGCTESTQREKIFDEMTKIFRVPYDALYRLWLNGPKDARLIDQYGAVLGLKEKESPVVTKWDDMFWSTIREARNNPKKEEELKKYWEQHRDELKKAWRDWKQFKGIPWMK